MKHSLARLPWAVPALLASMLSGCSNPDIKAVGIQQSDTIVIAWNDLGMHCLNPTYDEAVILPPYNTIWAQVIRRGAPPQVVTSGVTVEYRIVGNTSSSGKTDSHGGIFAQFWTHAQHLFGVSLAVDTGLNLAEPAVHNGLAGALTLRGDHFTVDGVPLVPVLDDNSWNPYQAAEITVRSAGQVIAQTRCTVPTSDEIDCAKCHAQGGTGTVHLTGGGGASPFNNILLAHDVLHETSHVDNKPVLCASCHASPALGSATPGDPEDYLSRVIHGSHAARGAACYDCHPGAVTKCTRSLAHTADDGYCVACHGDLAQVASSIATGGRVPWVSEPKCVACHGEVQEVDTGAVLYRNAKGHGGIYCAGCHGSPHAMAPSREAGDNYQALQYQSRAKSLGSCAVCHDNSHGGGAGEFGEEHGGPDGQPSACNVCHTSVPANPAAWPHRFTWAARP